jgi:hypothetical protein
VSLWRRVGGWDIASARDMESFQQARVPVASRYMHGNTNRSKKAPPRRGLGTKWRCQKYLGLFLFVLHLFLGFVRGCLVPRHLNC